MIEDFQSSGLIDSAAKKYRVIAFDRPGFGHSERPRINDRRLAESIYRAAVASGIMERAAYQDTIAEAG